MLRCGFILPCIFTLIYSFEYEYPTKSRYVTQSCGRDNSPISYVYDGMGRIETYPWLGMLYYPIGRKRLTTVVVLVTRQLVIGTATEIDKIPKQYFRSRARVILGHNSTGPSIQIREYTFHPEYETNTFSALALIQLKLDHVTQELRPICPPPTHFVHPRFYAMTLSEDMKQSAIQIYRMSYVRSARCKQYYRKSGLDMGSFWPTHFTCAKAQYGGVCLWRGGTVLVTKQGDRWSLLGFGVYGPGCQAPARFLDYGMYHQWIAFSVAGIGKPAITRMGPDLIILRRSLSNMQRYGPCDHEETRHLLYTDMNTINIGLHTFGLRTVRYNLTIYQNVEYHCVMIHVENRNASIIDPPQIRLQRWCAGSVGVCHGFQFLSIDFYIEIKFKYSVQFKLYAYGRRASIIDSKLALVYVNSKKKRPSIPIAKN